jgi:hypothetical protein
LYINSNGIEDVNNIAKKNKYENSTVKQETSKEIDVINKTKPEKFNLKTKNNSINENKTKKKKNLCSIL